MDNMRRKSSKRYKKRRGNQYTNGKVVQSVIKHILDEIEASEMNKVVPEELPNDPPINNNPEELEETDNEVNLNSTTVSDQTNASFNKLKDFPVIHDELNFAGASSSSPCLDNKRRQIVDEATRTNTNLKSKLEHSNVSSVAGIYQIIDFDILASTYAVMACPECFNTSCLELKKVNKQGLSLKLCLSCSVCDFNISFWTSKKIAKKRSYDINKRCVYAFRRLGKGYAGIKKFLILMNLPPPMTKKNYARIARCIHKAVKSVAQSTMNEAGKEIKTLKGVDSSTLYDTSISNDGAWQRRGFASMNRNIATISVETGRVIDTEPMSRYCQSCALNYKLKSTEPQKYEAFLTQHEGSCMANHKGSAGAMEVVGTQRIFQRSIEKHGLRYVKFLGDGNSKSFPAVVDTYDGLQVEKLECIGHVQKRVGNRLRKLKKDTKGLGGRGKLTKHVIDKLQNYYGMAIRQNSGDLESMKKATAASLFHVASSAKNNYHTHCPKGPNSWCLFNADQANKTSKYVPGAGLPLKVIKAVKPIYQELTNESLLQKYTHGQTQNRKESFNGMIWHRVPKDVYVGRQTFETGVYDAVAHFNIGNLATLKVLELLGFEPGTYTKLGCSSLNQDRVTNAKRHTTDNFIFRRRIIRGNRKRKADDHEGAEGKLYCSGIAK